MNTENKDWKPEVGKTAWNVFLGQVSECMILQELPHEWGFTDRDFIVQTYISPKATVYKESLFPTMEAALASIKVYDLEGKEVVVAHEITIHVSGFCPECAKDSYLDDEAMNTIEDIAKVGYNMKFTPNPEGETRLKATQERLANFSNGGQSEKTDGRDHGC